MEIIPAVDLRGGKCVRLYQGDYSKETIFSDDPVSMALRWQVEGASRLHLVDLDGAAAGELRNLSTIERVVNALRIPVEVGGGIRTIETIELLLGLGVERAILGTVAVENQALVADACRVFGDRVIVGIDARDGLVATRGWLRKSALTAAELARAVVALGAQRLVYTDIGRDGTLTSPNFQAVAELMAEVSVPVIAAGGITSIQHLQKLSDIGAEAAIVGRAIYSGDIDLAEAIKAVSGTDGNRKSGTADRP